MFCFVCLLVFYLRETKISYKLRIYFDSITETFKPENAWFNGQYHYLTDNCSKDRTEEIVANFKALLFRSSIGHHICGSIPDCQNNINFDVDCGEQTRRRRDTTASVPLTVNLALKVPLSNYSNTLLKPSKTSLQISSNPLAALEPAATLNITGVVIVADTTRPPETHLTSFVCGDRQVPSGTRCGKDLRQGAKYCILYHHLAHLQQEKNSDSESIILGKAPETVKITFLLTPRM